MGDGGETSGGPAVLRLGHSAVVDEWRDRDRALRRLGVDVRLLTARRWNEGGRDVAFAPGPDGFASAAATLGRHPNAFLYDPRPLWRLLGARRWDLLDVHEEPFSLAMAEFLLLRALRRSTRRVPFVCYSAQNLDRDYPPPFGWVERAALHRAGGAYPCNQAAGRRLRRKGLRGEVRVLPLGVDLDRFAPAERPPPGRPAVVGYVGRLEDHKGVGVLLEALARAPDLVAHLVGDGPAAPALRSRAARGDLEGRVRFDGFVAHGDLPGLYRSFDVLAVPSVETPTWIEQFCRVAVEAMASGVPVVASHSGALPEVVGRGGVLVPPGDAGALAAALGDLTGDPGRWAALRGTAVSWAAEFTWAAVARGQAGLYDAVLAR
jgi:glycosyltransferase involved in cell wall biosynthesis